ncbi:hypothetical protein [Georgenia sp. SUBG003]|uniref:hypothetical protein n=1 Tax=Georgenia sp. SUBG003 TaxID=1497974 RepID=UPI0004D48908|nr:hypothetical protein DA06_11595 [Georgenia sp. SUBG003]
MRGGQPAATLGFADFASVYESRFARWLEPFGEDLKSADAASSERLRELQAALASLVIKLDHRGIYRSSHQNEAGTEPKWLTRSWAKQR